MAFFLQNRDMGDTRRVTDCPSRMTLSARQLDQRFPPLIERSATGRDLGEHVKRGHVIVGSHL